MGEYTGNNGNSTRWYPVPAADLDDMAPWACGKSEYTDDAHPDSWKLCLVGKFGCEIRHRGMEYVGCILGDWMSARLFAGHGYLL